MNSDQGFELHPGAAQDITEIWEFIFKDSPPAAKRIREEILGAIHNLLPFPHQGHMRTDLTSRPLRFQIVRDYLIAYAPDEKPIVVIAVLHGQRNPRMMAAILHKKIGTQNEKSNCIYRGRFPAGDSSPRCRL